MPDGMQLIFANIVRDHHRGDGLGRGNERHAVLLVQRRASPLASAAATAAKSSRQSPRTTTATASGSACAGCVSGSNDDETQPSRSEDRRHLPEARSTGRWTSKASASSATTRTAAGRSRNGDSAPRSRLHALAKTFRWRASSSRGIANAARSPAAVRLFPRRASISSFLPAGAVGLYDIRALVADNMAPNLDSTFPDGEGMALLKWHQTHDSTLACRPIARCSDWIAENHALSLRRRLRLLAQRLRRALVHSNVFIFFAKSEADNGLLIVGEVLLLKNPEADRLRRHRVRHRQREVRRHGRHRPDRRRFRVG